MAMTHAGKWKLIKKENAKGPGEPQYLNKNGEDVEKLKERVKKDNPDIILEEYDVEDPISSEITEEEVKLPEIHVAIHNLEIMGYLYSLGLAGEFEEATGRKIKDIKNETLLILKEVYRLKGDNKDGDK